MYQPVPTSKWVKKCIAQGLGAHFPAGYLVGTVSKVSRHNSGEFAQIDVIPAAQLAGGHHVVVLFSDSLAMEQPHVTRLSLVVIHSAIHYLRLSFPSFWHPC